MRTEEWTRRIEEVHSWDGTTVTVGYEPAYSCRPTGTSSFLPTTSDVVFRGIDEYVEFLPSKPDIWQCSYCGTKHWIEDRQLQCSKCGGPRDV